MELLVESEIIAAHRLTQLQQEASELIAIFTTSVKNAKSRRNAEARGKDNDG
ncbi:MAG TPA: hypothetical protein VKA15_15635 [Isosphaeraceae bacterium]|nr:hypothetical protein [Isosphaeraceae bacterium]